MKQSMIQDANKTYNKSLMLFGEVGFMNHTMLFCSVTDEIFRDIIYYETPLNNFSPMCLFLGLPLSLFIAGRNPSKGGELC